MPHALADTDQGKEAIVRWYRQRALTWLPRRIRPWAQRMGVQPGDLEVRDLGYRWGSLGRDDRLNELAHIGQPRHTPAFGPPSNEPCPATTNAAPA